MLSDEAWMARALRIGSLSLGRTWPNPGVGCVLVRDGVLLGQGRTAVYGQAHAEVNAIAHCRAQGGDPTGATAFVTLAPCTRQGRQGPCVTALIGARVARVVAAIADPNQDHPGSLLDQAGIAYELGCLADVAQQLHGGFLMRITHGRPRLTGKWAMTLDGCIATATGDSAWISSPEARALSRRRRRLFDAIVVGAGTVAHDDPLLLSTHVEERTPVRVVVSATARLPLDRSLVRSQPRSPVLVVHDASAPSERQQDLRRLGVDLLSVADAHDPRQVAAALARHGFNEVLVEGGSQVHGAFLRAGLYDRLELYLGASVVGGGQPPASGSGAALIADAAAFEPEQPPRLYGDCAMLRYRRRQPVDQEPVVVLG